MLTEFETIMLGVLMIIIMLGMGASLTFKDFAIAFRKPHAIIVGMVCQYGLMPLTAFLLATALEFRWEYMLGLILVGCMPGGTTSNIFVYFSKGRLSLSILMTVCSTLMALVMVPVTIALYGSIALHGQGLEESFALPVSEVAKTLFVLLIPTVIGIALRKYNANVGAVIELLGGIMGVAVIVFLIATWVPRNWQLLMDTAPSIYLVTIGLGLIGFTLGYFIARSGFGVGKFVDPKLPFNLRIDPVRSRTISMETGIQNGILAILLVAMIYSDHPNMEHFLLIPVLYSLFIVLTSTAITFPYRWMTKREELARDNAKIGAIKEK